MQKIIYSLFQRSPAKWITTAEEGDMVVIQRRRAGEGIRDAVVIISVEKAKELGILLDPEIGGEIPEWLRVLFIEEIRKINKGGSITTAIEILIVFWLLAIRNVQDERLEKYRNEIDMSIMRAQGARRNQGGDE